MKRLFAFALTLALVLSLSVTAFAADEAGDGSITITNATSGQTYAPYKIFDATLTKDNSGISYTIKKDDQFFSALFPAVNEDGTAENTYFTYTPIDGTYGAVAIKTPYDKATLVGYLQRLVETYGKTPAANEVKADGEIVEFKNLPYGYYVITSTLGAAVTIDSANPHADVQDKNTTTITLNKTADGVDGDVGSNTVKVGDKVNFEVTFNAPNYLGKEKIEVYNIHDKLSSEWAKIDIDSITIKVDEKNLVKGTDYTVTNGTTTGFDINIPWVDNDDDFLYEAPSEVTITYTAVVQDAAAAADPNTNAEDEVNKNTAKLTWNNKTEGVEDDTTTKTFNMGFTKVDDDTEAPLAGAEFKLYKDLACTEEIYVKGSDGVYTVTTDTENSDTIVTPAETGKIVIMGLDTGVDYYLKEIKAPDGYNLMATSAPVKLGDTAVEFDADDYVVNFATNIENNKGVELPSTGGKGTMMLITIGTMVAMGFAVLLITHKKMSVYHD